MQEERLIETVRAKFGDAGQWVLVVGDLMLDRYFIGEVERISPEAPVPAAPYLHGRISQEFSELDGKPLGQGRAPGNSFGPSGHNNRAWVLKGNRKQPEAATSKRLSSPESGGPSRPAFRGSASFRDLRIAHVA